MKLLYSGPLSHSSILDPRATLSEKKKLNVLKKKIAIEPKLVHTYFNTTGGVFILRDKI